MTPLVIGALLAIASLVWVIAPVFEDQRTDSAFKTSLTVERRALDTANPPTLQQLTDRRVALQGTLTAASLSTAGTIALTKGTRTSPELVATWIRSWAGRWSTRETVPTSTPSRITRRPTSWWSYQASSSSDGASRSWSTQRIALMRVSATERSGTSLKNATGCEL